MVGRDNLHEFVGIPQKVRLTREFSGDPLHESGYILGLSDELVLLHRFHDFFVVGYHVYRLADITSFRIREGRDGRARLVFDYRRVAEGKPGPLEVVARLGGSRHGEKLFAGIDASRAAGTYRVVLGDGIRERMEREGVEVFVMLELLSNRVRGDTGLRREEILYRYKLSNSVTTGRATPRIGTRPMTPDERRRAEVWKKPRPEIGLPPGE